MKAYLTLAVLLIVLGIANTAHADTFYCADKDGTLHLDRIDHDDFLAGKKPYAMEQWNCSAVFVVLSSHKLEEDTDLTDKVIIIRVANEYWNSNNSFNNLWLKNRGDYEGKHVGQWDPLYVEMTKTVFGNNLSPEYFAFLTTMVRATVKIESDGNPSSLSSAGAMGLIQIMPSTLQDATITIRQMLAGKSPFEPQTNLAYGIDELRRKFEKIQGWVRNGSVTWTVKKNGTRERRMIALEADKLWFYILTAYNRGVRGWLDWEWQNRQNGAPILSDYAKKWAKYATAYCPGIDLVNGRCAPTPEWLRKATNNPQP